MSVPHGSNPTSDRTPGAPLTHSDYLGSRRFWRLDGLRAISILLVVTAHPAYQRFWPAFHGAAGVSIFFVLSGFLITTLLLREQSSSGQVALGAFYIRRLFRIYPLFLLVLAVYCVLILIAGMQPDRREVFIANLPYFIPLPEHAFFGSNGGVLVPFDGSWSIGVEEKFYLVWPLVGFLLLGTAVRLRAAVLAGVIVVLGVLDLYFDWGRWIAPYSLIAMGALTALLLHERASYTKLSTFGKPRILALIALLCTALQFGTSEILPGGRLYVAYGLVLSALLAGLVTSTSPGLGWLSSRPMVYIGALSYALYLIHNFALNFAEKLVPQTWGLAGSLLSTAIALAGAIAVAHVVHRFFEDPIRRYGARLAHERRIVGTVPSVQESK